MFKNIMSFLKKEIVLTISGLLAIISCFFVPPDAAYMGYIDFHTILILLRKSQKNFTVAHRGIETERSHKAFEKLGTIFILHVETKHRRI